MPRAARLSGSAIRRLTPEKRQSSGLFSLIVAKTPGKSALACTVSKKVSPRAADRNRVKRRMRAAMRAFLPFPPETSFIVIAKKAAVDATYAQVEHDLRQLMSRAIGVT
jgi:ribonuclease P protein component